MFDFIAIDWGSVRTGLAFGSTETGLVVPYTNELDTKDLFDTIDHECKKRKIKIFVVGLPTNFKLKKTDISNKVLLFAEKLSEAYPEIKVEFVNENSTSKIGKDLKSKHQINHNAALEIGRRYLDSILA
ncbi:MAG: RuvX/YqgF family protein [Patescibacteria group bacterium]